jgi:hypothetical protein
MPGGRTVRAELTLDAALAELTLGEATAVLARELINVFT